MAVRIASPIRNFQAPDPLYENFDTFVDVIPAAKKRGMKVYPYYCETSSSGIKHLWLIDPRIELLEVFELINRHWSLRKSATGGAPVRAVPFDAMEFPLRLLWPLGSQG